MVDIPDAKNVKDAWLLGDVLYGECLKRREPFPAKYDILRECEYMNVYSLRKAIEDGKVRLKST